MSKLSDECRSVRDHLLQIGDGSADISKSPAAHLGAVLVPYFIGLIAYLLIRHPIQVTCPSCGHRVSSDASFCPRCGKELKFLCTQCHQPLVNSSRFCSSCGTEVAQAKDTDN